MVLCSFPQKTLASASAPDSPLASMIHTDVEGTAVRLFLYTGDPSFVKRIRERKSPAPAGTMDVQGFLAVSLNMGFVTRRKYLQPFAVTA